MVDELLKAGRSGWLALTAGSKGMARMKNEGPPPGIQSPSLEGATLIRAHALTSVTELGNM